MNILILGNGFDLAHDLKTSYSDFFKYCQYKYDKPSNFDFRTNVFFTNVWIRHFINKQNWKGINWIDVEEEIYNILVSKHTLVLPILENGNCQQILKVKFVDKDFSLDNMYKFLSDPLPCNPFESGYFNCNETDNTWHIVRLASSRGFIDFLYAQLREFTGIFEKYLLEEVLINISTTPKYQLTLQLTEDQAYSKDINVLNFNYTDTCERLYDKRFNANCDMNIKTFYVHGQVDKCNLVLGTQSFNRSSFSWTLPADFNIFQKHYQRHKYGTIEQYQDLLREVKQSKIPPIFHIVGHSLDRTDHNILKHILLANQDSKINIYYHDEEAQERLMNNINAIIGEEEVMARVCFIYQHDEERGILR